MMLRLKILLLLFLPCTTALAQNYDEVKVPAYTLPPVLKSPTGNLAKDKKAWEESRRKEILTLFEDHVYGKMPVDYDSLSFKIRNENKQAMKGKAHLKEVAISIWKGPASVVINLTLFTPNNKRKAPVFLLINNRSKRNTEPSRDTVSQFWPAEQVIDSGYGIAAFHVSDAAPDDKNNYVKGVLALYPNEINSASGMKAIGAWAWAARRVMDYFEKDKEVDAGNVYIVGHSRGGKAALWAGAHDRRFAMVFSNCSGNTGAALSRRKFGETIARINTSFPHWFTDNYKKYNDNEAALPVDQHMLLALMAPRPLYVTNASKDLWADPTGTFLSLKTAGASYALYGKKAPLPSTPPAINSPIFQSILGYHNREGIHDLTSYDWNNFIRFASFHLKGSR
ncbi:MAG TPA: hypothetical protein VM935_08085 [Chitinophagaceae bacterium]|nr:hypothetical protein [Chitinophagaceae bacterium]